MVLPPPCIPPVSRGCSARWVKLVPTHLTIFSASHLKIAPLLRSVSTKTVCRVLVWRWCLFPATIFHSRGALRTRPNRMMSFFVSVKVAIEIYKSRVPLQGSHRVCKPGGGSGYARDSHDTATRILDTASDYASSTLTLMPQPPPRPRRRATKTPKRKLPCIEWHRLWKPGAISLLPYSSAGGTNRL